MASTTPEAQLLNWLTRYLNSVRRELFFDARHPQDINNYGYLPTFEKDVRAFYKTVFKSYENLQREVKTALKDKSEEGRFHRVHERSKDALARMKKLLYYLSNMNAIKPDDFYAGKAGEEAENCDEIVRARLALI